MAGPGCALLLTTRDQAIARAFAPVAHEFVHELSEDEAVGLLNQLCRQAASADAAAVRRLARAVGGLPLALKLCLAYKYEGRQPLRRSTRHLTAFEICDQFSYLFKIQFHFVRYRNAPGQANR